MSQNQNKLPSIYNDVIGPVMRGPSSSHCAGALRIGRIARDLMQGNIQQVDIMFDSGGSLATTHKTQGSDMGLFGGLMGMEVTDEQLKTAERSIGKSGIKVNISIENLNDRHPNTYNLLLKNDKIQHEVKAISTGGGIIEIINIDGFEVSMAGDFFELLIFSSDDINNIHTYLKNKVLFNSLSVHTSDTKSLIEIRNNKPFTDSLIQEIKNQFDPEDVVAITPVLPVLSGTTRKVPFTTVQEMVDYNQSENLDLSELAIAYESARGNLSHSEVIEMMANIINILENSIDEGLSGTEYRDRILGFQSGTFSEMNKNGQLLDGGMLNRMTLYVTALMEVKSAMGIIVAAPTAGACGGLPGAIIGAGHDLKLSSDEMIKSMLAAGLIGVFIAHGATFAAEVGGCQAETGAGAGMAAAGLVQLKGGNVKQALSAASIALQNTFGMTCDPVANRVEAPCLGKNVMAAANALTCANMALADFDAVIPLDEVIDAMYQVGRSLPHELRCTALGGLSITPTSKRIEERLLKIKEE